MKKKLITLLLAVAMMYCLSGCFVKTLYENYKTEHVTVVVTEEDIIQLEDYPNLLSADLSGSTCYDAIEAYKAEHPEVEVTYTIKVLDDFYPMETTELDLSAMTSDRVDEVIEQLVRLPEVAYINLMTAEGTSSLTLSDVQKLMEYYPAIDLTYSFDFFGQTVDLYQERLEYVEVEMGDAAEAQLREMLTVMPNINYIKLDRCGFTSPVLHSVNQDFPDTKVVWRVFYGRNGNRFNALTDETVIRSSHYLTNETISEMQYLTDVVYMDIGHNETLTDISFVSSMPNLKLLILSGSPIRDISPLANHPSLEFAELCFCGNLQDLTPLQNCTALKYLNVSGTYANDISCLMELNLERFVTMLNRVPMAQKNEYEAAHPDCLIVKTGKQPYGYGWRYVDDGYNFNEYYKTMRLIFHYDQEALLNGYQWDEVTATDPDWDL